MTATLAAEFTAAAAFLLLLYIAHLLDADDTRTVPVYTPHATTVHPCWAEYDPAVLRAARLAVAAEMAAVRLELRPIGMPDVEMVHIGHRELVGAR
jgi:hypothetical protein